MPERLFSNFRPTWVVAVSTCNQEPERSTGQHGAWVPGTVLRS